MSLVSIDMRMIELSGIGTYLSNVVPRIINSESGIDFCLMGDADKLKCVTRALNRNVKVVHCDPPIYSIEEQFKIPSSIPSGTSLFWSPHYNIPLLYRGKLLVTVYDTFHLAMPQLVGGWHKRLYAKLMFGAVRSKAQAILAISEFTKQELIRFTGSHGAPVYPILLGVDAEKFSAPIDKSPHSNPFLLYIGNVKPHKNLVNLVQAFVTIADQIPHDLIIVGKKDGFITGDHQVARAASVMGERIRFTGHVEFDLLRRFLGRATALVFPSLYEGFGLPPLEAMAAGCPVICSNAASLPEVCGSAAMYFDPLDVTDIAAKILTVVTDDALRDTLRRKGIQRARELDWDTCAGETGQILRGLIE